MSEIKFEETIKITCTDTDVESLSIINKFKEKEYIEAVIQGVILYMKYNGYGLYIGEKFGMEFSTPGPKSYTINRR